MTDEVSYPPNRSPSASFREFIEMILKKNPKERVPCRDLLQSTFIRKYRDLETCEELCQ